MARFIYYVAASLDGYIADSHGSVDWLPPPTDGEDYGYADFYAGIGTVVMGAATYEFILAHGGETWVYPGVDSIVLTRRTLPQPPGGTVRFSGGDVGTLIAELRARSGGDVWIVGGGQVAAAFAQHNALDEYDISIMPVLLGNGIPLLAPFAPIGGVQPLHLHSQHRYPSGVLRVRYTTRPPAVGAEPPA